MATREEVIGRIKRQDEDVDLDRVIYPYYIKERYPFFVSDPSKEEVAEALEMQEGNFVLNRFRHSPQSPIDLVCPCQYHNGLPQPVSTHQRCFLPKSRSVVGVI